MKSFVGGLAAVVLLVSGVARAQDSEAQFLGFKKFDVFGYLKLDYSHFTSPSTDALIGSNGGFSLVNARIGVEMTPIDRLDVVLSVDGFVAQRGEDNPLQGGRIVELRDAFLDYDLNPYLQLRGGQFRAPFNAESLMRDRDLPFVTRSIVTEGMLPPQGYRTSGISLDRQLGVQVGSDRLGGDFAVQYAAAVVNGNGANTLDNDNNAVTPVGRFSFLFKETAAVSLNAFYNPRTVGVLPNRIDQTELGYGADVQLHFGGLHLLGMVLATQTSFPETAFPTEQGMGAMIQVRYLVDAIGLEAGARFAWLEPSDRQPFDQLTEGTVMVGYRVSDFPARVMLQYTIRGEEAGAQIGNDSLDAMAQVTF